MNSIGCFGRIGSQQCTASSVPATLLEIRKVMILSLQFTKKWHLNAWYIFIYLEWSPHLYEYKNGKIKCIDLHYYVVVNITTIHFHYQVVTIFGSNVHFTVVTFTIQFLQCSNVLFFCILFNIVVFCTDD